MTEKHIADSHEVIRVVGARENNLKNVDVDIPKRRLTVFTGVSGSGKSSLVFGTIANESQRLINETYPTFVQQFMGQLNRPEVDALENVSPAIIVDQERMGANSRSTVGTATDAHAMLRILFSRLGQPHVGSPQAFSFNIPSVSGAGAVTFEKGGKTVKERRSFEVTGGMCPKCEGLGEVSDVDLDELFDKTKSLAEGAITIPGYNVDGWMVKGFTESGLVDPAKPIEEYTEQERHDFLYKEPTKIKMSGINMTYEGLVPKITKSFLTKDRDALQPHIRAFVDRAVKFMPCPECGGSRLNEGARSSKIKGINIADAAAMQITDLAEWLSTIDDPAVGPLMAGLRHTIDSFVNIGLGYLSLDRASGTLSGGESQRTKMIRHLGSALTDISYVFDEPTAGLHPHDIQRMNDLLQLLRDKGNTVLVVEHKPEVIEIADHIVDLGPGAGRAGGEIQYTGDVAGLRASGTITGRHLDDRAKLKPSTREKKGALEIRGATQHNLKDVDVDVPLGILTVVTGVAGSGKSSLIHGNIPAFDDVVVVDQSPIKGNRRSSPATYTGILDTIRTAFAKANGVKPALFSANSEGACPACRGLGVIITTLGFTQTVETLCELCGGSGFSDDVLDYLLEGKNIAEVLAMSASEAAEFLTKGPAHA
ncbi:MAG: excinuclease ABC subunit UvrA, partial [Microbacterium sp.]